MILNAIASRLSLPCRQVGRQEPVMVLRVDKEKGYIDLSKRRVAAEDIQVCIPVKCMLHMPCEKTSIYCLSVRAAQRHVSIKHWHCIHFIHDRRWTCNTHAIVLHVLHCQHKALRFSMTVDMLPEVQAAEEKYNKSKMVHSIMRHVAETTGQDLEQLYSQIGWPLYKLYGHAFEAFKQMVQEPEPIFARLQVLLPIISTVSGSAMAYTDLHVHVCSCSSSSNVSFDTFDC